MKKADCRNGLKHWDNVAGIKIGPLWPWRRLVVLVEILSQINKPFALVSALQSVWFFYTFSDVSNLLFICASCGPLHSKIYKNRAQWPSGNLGSGKNLPLVLYKLFFIAH